MSPWIHGADPASFSEINKAVEKFKVCFCLLFNLLLINRSKCQMTLLTSIRKSESIS